MLHCAQSNLHFPHIIFVLEYVRDWWRNNLSAIVNCFYIPVIVMQMKQPMKDAQIALTQRVMWYCIRELCNVTFIHGIQSSMRNFVKITNKALSTYTWCLSAIFWCGDMSMQNKLCSYIDCLILILLHLSIGRSKYTAN